MSIEDALHSQGQAVRQQMAAWDLDGFVERLGQRIAAETDSSPHQPERPVSRRRQSADRPCPARPAGRQDRRATQADPQAGLSHEEELVRLCEDAVAVPELRPLLEDFLEDYEPSGARVFGCLLYLADQADQALFWWRFACGGEDGLAAYCLTLHSRATGTPRETRTWAAYADIWRFDPEEHWPQPDSEHHPDTRRLTDCVQAHLRTEEEEDADIVLPTADLPRELVAL